MSDALKGFVDIPISGVIQATKTMRVYPACDSSMQRLIVSIDRDALSRGGKGDDRFCIPMDAFPALRKLMDQVEASVPGSKAMKKSKSHAKILARWKKELESQT